MRALVEVTAAVAVLLLLLAACESAGGAADDGERGRRGCQHPRPDAVGLPDGGPAGEPDADGRDGGAAPLPDTGAPPIGEAPRWCRPLAAIPEPAVARAAFAWVEEQAASGCTLDRIETDADGDGTVDDVRAVAVGESGCFPDGGACGEPLVAFGWSWQEERTPFYVAGTDVRTALVTAARGEDGAVRIVIDMAQWSSSAQQRFERVYDAAGRLLGESHRWNDALWFRRDVEWDGDRPARATLTDYVNYPAPRTWTWTWTYDAEGRLAGGRIERTGAPEETLTAAWTYGVGGRPERVERTLGGVPWVTQTWRYDGAGRLLERDVTMANDVWPVQGVLDDHTPGHVGADSEYGDWFDALPRADGECTRLPAAATHGYPAAERVYELGWPTAERPGGIGFDYGYDGYAYYYGDGAWFGHGGVAGGMLPYGGPTTRHAVIGYDDRGRAVREDLEETEADGPGRRVVRERTYDGDQLVADHRTVTDPADDAAAGALTSLHTFAWDGDGRLAERRYDLDGLAVAAHTWSYDAAGRVRAHGIAWHGGDYFAFVGQESPWQETRPDPSAFEGEPPLRFVYERLWSADGRRVEKRKRDARLDAVTAESTEEYDAAGRLTLRARGTWHEVWSWDGAGRLLLHGTDEDVDDDLERTVRLAYDDGGRLTLHETETELPPAHRTVRYVYACDASAR